MGNEKQFSDFPSKIRPPVETNQPGDKKGATIRHLTNRNHNTLKTSTLKNQILMNVFLMYI